MKSVVAILTIVIGLPLTMAAALFWVSLALNIYDRCFAFLSVVPRFWMPGAGLITVAALLLLYAGIASLSAKDGDCVS